jgi:hypothetical protein
VHSLRYCPSCDTNQTAEVVACHVTLLVLGEPIALDTRVAICCDCGQWEPDPVLDETTFNKAKALYRTQHGRLADTPSPPNVVLVLSRSYASLP